MCGYSLTVTRVFRTSKGRYTLGPSAIITPWTVFISTSHNKNSYNNNRIMIEWPSTWMRQINGELSASLKEKWLFCIEDLSLNGLISFSVWQQSSSNVSYVRRALLMHRTAKMTISVSTKKKVSNKDFRFTDPAVKVRSSYTTRPQNILKSKTQNK